MRHGRGSMRRGDADALGSEKYGYQRGYIRSGMNLHLEQIFRCCCVVVRPIVCDITKMGLKQLFVGLAIFVSVC